MAVLFGREDRGLTNEELQLCNLHLNIPTDSAYSSLNLAMAVQIVCYELRMLAIADELPGQISAGHGKVLLGVGIDVEKFLELSLKALQLISDELNL